MSTYNYSSYASPYGQQYAQQYSAQQSTSGYVQPYGQSAYSTAGSSTSVTASNSYAYASAVTTTASSTNYGYSTGYNYNYTSDNSSTLPAYNASNTQSSVLQAFQHSWYPTPSQASAATAQHVAATTQQTAPTTVQQVTQQQAFGYNVAAQYAQMYAQQQFSISSSTSTGKAAQPTANWGNYSQTQHASIPNRTDPAKTGWGSYTGATATASPASQQKSTGIVYRSPMKYSQDSHIQSGYNSGNTSQPYNPNQSYKNTSSITGQGYNSSNPGYSTNSGYSNTMGQNYGTSNNYNLTNSQGYSSTNLQFKSPSNGGYSSTTGYSNSSQTGFGQSYNQQNYNKNYGGNVSRNDGSQIGRSPSNNGQKNPLRGPVESPFQPFQPQGSIAGQGRGASINNRGKGVIRPLMGRGSPIGGNSNYGGPGRPGPQNGPDIPPFPQAWHSQDFDGTGPVDFQRNQGAGFNDGTNRWNRGGTGRGRYSQQSQQQQRGMYSNNSRNARGTSGSNRELWSPAGKKADGSNRSSLDSKSPINVNDLVEKDKKTEIKSFLYAWLGARHARPVYDIRQVGERPNISFRCDLRVDKFPFVGVGEAANKKEAQTAAAWDFADFLTKNGDLNEADLPPRNSKGADDEEDFGTIKDEEDFEEKKELEERNGNRKGDNRKGRDQRWGNQQSNFGGRGARQNAGRGRQQQQQQQQVEIQPLMSLPLAGHPWDGPGPPHMPMGMNMPPPRPLLPPPGMNQWDDGWGFPMGPPPPHVMMMMMRGHMGPPPPPFMRRNQNEYWRRRDMEERMYDMKWNQGDWQNPEDIFIHQMIRNQQESERHRGRNHPMPLMDGMPGDWHSMAQSRPIVTSDDRHVMAKHSVVYPQEGELKTLHRIVNTVEQALKLLSDKFVDEDHPKEEAAKEEEENDAKSDDKSEKEESQEDKKEVEAGESDAKEDSTKKDEKKQDDKRAKIKILKRPKKTPKLVDTRPRVLCGVNRVGPLAKGLLISKDDRVDLVLLCGAVPTMELLDRIMGHMEDKLLEVDETFKLSVTTIEEEAGFLVETVEEPFVKLFVTLTATSLRKKREETKRKEKVEEKSEECKSEEKTSTQEEEVENNEEESKKDEEQEEQTTADTSPVSTLPKQKMLDALARLRHTHWFQAKVADFQSCVILIRIIRDMQRRDDVWEPIPAWPLEVLMYHCLVSSDEHHMTPGVACRRFFEVIAGGILLPGMPGIQDPCEKESRDILDSITEQDKEAITKSAQLHLRHVAFREIHKVLGMGKLPPTYKMTAEMRQGHSVPDPLINKSEGTKDRDEKQTESNNLRKRRFEPNGNDSVAESPKRSLTDEEDTDTQQNMAELSISDEASECRSLEETDEQKKEEESSHVQDDDNKLLEKEEDHMDDDIVLSQEEEDALLEENMDS